MDGSGSRRTARRRWRWLSHRLRRHRKGASPRKIVDIVNHALLWAENRSLAPDGILAAAHDYCGAVNPMAVAYSSLITISMISYYRYRECLAAVVGRPEHELPGDHDVAAVRRHGDLELAVSSLEQPRERRILERPLRRLGWSPRRGPQRARLRRKARRDGTRGGVRLETRA